MESSKRIKIYGTLINDTLDVALNGGTYNTTDFAHNDAIAYAKQLYDDYFDLSHTPGYVDQPRGIGNMPVERFQDRINRRVTGVWWDGTTTHIYDDLFVHGDTNIGGDLTVEGDSNLEVVNATTINADTINGDTINVENITITGDIHGIALNDLDDVTVTNPQDKECLVYDDDQDLWVSNHLNLGDLGNVNISRVQEGDVLKFINGEWVASPDEKGLTQQDLTEIINDITLLKSMWKFWTDSTDNVTYLRPVSDNMPVYVDEKVEAKGFFDTTVNP